ncbi:DUF2630 family protein [Mucilaginibacter sp. X5P1]|uniref:DUF2630 family protein n=1 Tax=Mucilaginibacter sp. X5P1 TaxID=2723088 RepID=UPI0016226C43|nr:DUF2630 family protein [Mucilaginibacter sp. X5P1]MBB6139487.1 uncharacterized protein YjaG (DUF416 family) [Mucilaginibacter sp. X5P1]
MADQTQDNSVMSHIKKLTEKEEHLYGKENLTDEDIKELHKVKSELDQYWDLLHQRRALRDAGGNPNRAEMRSTDTIENYEE